MLNKIAEERLLRAGGEIEAGAPEAVSEALPGGTAPADGIPASEAASEPVAPQPAASEAAPQATAAPAAR